MTSVQRALKIHNQDSWAWLYIALIILSSSFLLGFILAFLIPGDERILITGFSYIFVYMFVLGIAGFNQTFAYAIGMSVRRTDYWLSMAIMGLRSSLLFTVLFIFLALIENWTNGWGAHLTFFNFPYLNDGTILEQLVVYFVMFVNVFFLGLFVASFTKRFGLKGLLILGVSLLLLISIAVILITYFQSWLEIAHWFIHHTAFQVSLWLIPFIALYMITSFLFIKKTEV